MAHKAHSLYTASLFSAGPTTTHLNQLSQLDVGPGVMLEELIAAGAVDRGAIVIGAAEPKVPIRSMDLATILTLIGVTTGLDCTSGATFRLQKRAHGSTFAGSGNHVTVTSSLGFACVRSLSASQGQLATVLMEYYALYDGTNAPLVYNASQNLAGTAPAVNSLYTIGPCKVGSTFIDDIQGIELDTGLEWRPLISNGELTAREVALYRRAPSLRITARNPTVAGNIGSLFNGTLGGTFVAFFTRKSEGSAGNVANATSSHLSISISAGAWRTDEIGVGGNDDAIVPVTISPTAALSISLSAAIA